MATKKTKNRRRASPGPTQEQRRERLEARRRERAAAEAAEARRRRRHQIVRIAVTTILAGALVWFVVWRRVPSPRPMSIDGHTVRLFDESFGVGVHPTGRVDYDTAPPVHGPHAAQPAACGVHSTEVSNEEQVHSLEHGAVGIQYRPDLGAADIAAIERIVGRFDSDVFSAPYPKMPTPIAVTSWGELMRLRSFDAKAINDYLDAYRGHGPERFASCPNAVDEPFRGP